MEKNQFHPKFKLLGKSFSSIDELISFSESISSEVNVFLIEWFSENDFIEVQTSGSTGSPKTIRLRKDAMKNSAKATGSFFKLKENTTALLCMSVNYIAGKMMLVRALELGWDMDIVEPISNPLKGIDKKYDFSAMVSLQLHNSLNEIYKVKKLIVGGGVVSTELFQNIQNVETQIFATYGMTETITHIAVKKLNNFRHFESFDVNSKQAKGEAISNKQITPSLVPHKGEIERYSELVSESHYRVLQNIKISQDSRNCLVINAPKIAEEDIITNDIVNLISEFQFEWLGRYDNIINSGGVKLIPEQIEQKLSKIIKERFFVCGLPDEVLGKKLILVIESLVTELVEVPTRSDGNKIRGKVKNLKSLSKFEQPKEIYFLPKFIETQTKKINRKETVKLF